MKTTEHLAPETIASLIPALTQLTTDQPTTAELEEALLASKVVTRAIFEWLASRYCAQAAARKAYEIPTETPEEREALNRIERAHPAVLNLGDINSPLIQRNSA